LGLNFPKNLNVLKKKQEHEQLKQALTKDKLQRAPAPAAGRKTVSIDLTPSKE
jgi:hypothetical protein